MKIVKTNVRYFIDIVNCLYVIRDRKHKNNIVTHSNILYELKSKVRNMNENNWQEIGHNEFFLVELNQWEGEIKYQH